MQPIFVSPSSLFDGELPVLLTTDHRVKFRLDLISSVCYLGYMLSAAGVYELVVTTRVKTIQKMFRELLPVLNIEDPWSWAELLCETYPETKMHFTNTLENELTIFYKYINHMTSRLGVIQRHVIKLINH